MFKKQFNLTILLLILVFTLIFQTCEPIFSATSKGKNVNNSINQPTGCSSGDCVNGQGTYTWASGNEYVGEWKDGKKNGLGTNTYANGAKYVGEYKDGKKNGQGALTWASGEKYVGEWKNGKRHGQGTYTWTGEWLGQKYVGEWKDDKYNGQGTFTWVSGNEYVGEWKNGKRHGQGTNTYASGQQYVGEWKDDKRNGQGTITNLNDGQQYVGEWKDDKRNGWGTWTTTDGHKYVGWFKNGKKLKGTYTLPNRDKYVGEWKDGKWHGQGIVTNINGIVQSGIWFESKFVKHMSFRSVESYLKENYSQIVTDKENNDPGFVSLPPILKIAEVSFPAGYLEAEKKEYLSITIQNTGPGEGRDIEVRLSGKQIAGLTYPSTTKSPTIPAYSGEKTIKIPIEGMVNLPDGEASLQIEIFDPYFYIKKTAKLLTIPTYKLETPKLKLAKYAVTEFKKENNRVDKNEMITVEFIVQNTDVGKAEDVMVSISNSQTGVRSLGEVKNGNHTGKMNFDTIGEIKGGEYVNFAYSFLVDNRFSGNQLDFSVQASERRGDYGFSESIHQGINTTLVAEGSISRSKKKREKKKGVIIEDVPDLVVDVDVEVPQTKMDNPHAIAVVIGNMNYESEEINNVDFAINDAVSIKRYLIETMGYKDGNIIFLRNAGQSDFLNVFGTEKSFKGKLYDWVKPNGSSDVFIYYSGHGAPGLKDKKGYFIPVDCDPQRVEINGYSIETLYNNLFHLPAKSITVVTDACFSGADIYTGISPFPPTIINAILDKPNTVIFSSSSGTQVSSWYEEKQHGLFTYYFLKAIHNKTADSNRDGKLTIQEIDNFVSDRNEGVFYKAKRLHGVEQMPTLQGTDKNRVLVRY